MRTSRILSVVIAVGLAVALVGSGVNAHEVSGVGTAAANSTVLSVDVGGASGVLALKVASDRSQASIDPVVGEAEAFTVLSPLSVASTLASALNTSVADVESRTKGDRSERGVPAVSVNNAAVKATIDPATLASIVDDAGARSTLVGGVSGVAAAGALLSVDAAGVNLSTDAGTNRSFSSRSARIDNLTVLNLGALFEALGISLDGLSVSAVGGLLTSLGVQLPMSGTLFSALPPVNGAAALQDALNKGNTAITELQQLDTAIANLLASSGLSTVLTALGVSDACGLLSVSTSTISAVPVVGPAVASLVTAASTELSQANTALGALGMPALTCSAIATLDTTVNTTIDSIRAALAKVLGDVLSLLDGTALLSVSNVIAGLTAKATSDPATSAASVDASIGSIRVGSLVIPGVDLLATAETLKATVDNTKSTVGGVLGGIVSDLTNIIDVGVLEGEPPSVTKGDDGYVRARAALTVLRVTITPPANLGQIAAGLVSPSSVGSQIQGFGGTVPALGSGMDSLESALSGQASASQVGGVQALASGATIRVLGFENTADFVVPGAGRSRERARGSEQLPATGIGTEWLMLAGAGLVLVGMRRSFGLMR